MVEILNPKVQASGLVDVAMLGLSKSLSERALAPMIGNGTLKSGALKLVGGSIAHGMAGKAGQIIGGGLVVDGIEDIVVSLLGGGMMGGAAVQQEVW